MAEEVGHAFVSLVPSARGFSAAAQREIRAEMAGKDIRIPVTPDVDRADVTRALTGATAGQRGAIPVATDVDAGQLRRETRTAILATEATRPTVHVRTDVDRNSFRRSLLGLSGTASDGGSSVSKAFSSSFGGGLLDPKTGLIIGLVALLSPPVLALVAPVTLLGASLATLLVAGFALRGNKQLKDAVGGLFKDIDRGLTKAAQPLVKPFLEAIKILRQTARELAPSLREMFAEVAPYIPVLAKGVAGFLKAFTPGLVEAVKNSGPVIEKLAWALPDLGSALSQFLYAMGQVAPQAAVFFGQVLRFLADVIRGFAIIVTTMVKFMDTYLRVVKLVWDIGQTVAEGLRQAAIGIGIIFQWAAKFADWSISISEKWKSAIAIIASAVVAVRDLFGQAVAKIREWWSRLWGNDLPNGARSGAGALVGFVRTVPGQIVGALGNMSRLLYQAGRNVLQGLIDGIASKLAALRNIMSQAAAQARSFWPFSPAKQGPLSGHGSLWYAGRNLMDDLTGGMQSKLPAVQSVSSILAGAVAIGGTSGVDAPYDGPEVLDLTLDLGEGIRKVLRINLSEHDRQIRRRVTAGAGAY